MSAACRLVEKAGAAEATGWLRGHKLRHGPPGVPATEIQVREAMTPHLAALQEGVPGNRGVVWEIGWSPRTLRAHVSRLSLVIGGSVGQLPGTSLNSLSEAVDNITAGLGGALTTACLDTSVEHNEVLEEQDADLADPLVDGGAVKDGSDGQRKPSRITFEGLEQQSGCDEPAAPDTSDEEMPMARQRTGCGLGGCGVEKQKMSIANFRRRADALDVGEYWAAETAAKKGKTSIDSIVALVQAERERWDEEKEALEANMEELKEKLRSMQAARSPDAEKQALKREHQELRKVIKARSRFGAWVCERHMKESEDEETDTEKEALRRKISDLFVRLRAARAAAGAASSESDVSPTRRCPGPTIRRRQ
ncbi:unnamed protein product [Symbiodinium necroappetens]|uniref:Uncharacterized protein n=1 Tax=Symbiodinium necroappetens TaxID=1628268 RepID=A0A813C597_9DINO|nr:unnamed protein product [Symbiodinium necroappetens]